MLTSGDAGDKVVDMPDGRSADLDELAASDHSRWLALHRDEADAAEEWLAAALGEHPTARAPEPPAVRRPLAPPQPPRHDATDWRIETGAGGTVVARHQSSGAVVTGSLALAATGSGVRFRLLRYHYALPDGFQPTGPPAPVASIEHAVNEPSVARALLQSLDEMPTAVAEIPPLRIPPAMLSGLRRSDEFYRVIANYVRTCRDHKIAYGVRLAADNHVSEGTVRSWVHEARRRGLLEPVRQGRR